MFWNKVMLALALTIVAEPMLLAKSKDNQATLKKGKKSKKGKGKDKKSKKDQFSMKAKTDPLASSKGNATPDLFPPHD